MKFNELLKTARNQAKMTQTQLADKVNVTQGTIANWERGVREPDLDTIKRIAHALNVHPEYFIKNDSFPQNETVIMKTETAHQNEAPPQLDEGVQRLVEKFNRLSSEDQEKAMSYMDFLDSEKK